jgi:hypothetical protein
MMTLREMASMGLYTGSAAAFISGGISNTEGFAAAKKALEEQGIPVTHDNVVKFLQENSQNMLHYGADAIMFYGPGLFLAAGVVGEAGLAGAIGGAIGGLVKLNTTRRQIGLAVVGLAAFQAAPLAPGVYTSLHDGFLSSLAHSFLQ